MEAIRNYLESMFQNLPNTPEVQRAKSELWQMMEDKYTELINSGKSENEAVGTVISEFGNLDEISEVLGIRSVVRQPQMSINRRMVSFEDVKQFLSDYSKQTIQIGLGVFLCINSVIGPIFFDAIGAPDFLGAISLFIFIAIAVGLFVHPAIIMKRWDFLKQEPCSIDFATTKYVRDQKEHYRTTYALLLTIGITLCVICVVPEIIFEEFNTKIWNMNLEALGGCLLFLLVGIGVFMIILGCRVNSSFSFLLQLNDATTVGGNFVPNQHPAKKYNNKTVETIMSVYWTTITCVYLCWSFLTFDWWITWIIWPVASIIHAVIDSAYKE
ncbi:MAG: permease prefix domain 1-containing protein [Agathobacter sp.]